ncbi:hypothetical protein LXL04_026720 [Taraxacum kok-saghyz]
MDSSESQDSDHPASGSVSGSASVSVSLSVSVSVSGSGNGSGDHDHSPTPSTSGSASSDSESSPMSSSDVGSNFARSTSTPSVGNSSSENPQSTVSESSGSLKTITSTDFEPEEEEDDGDDTMNDQSSPIEEQKETASPNVQETEESESSGSLKTITSTDFEPEDDDMIDIDTMNDQSTPIKEHKETALPNVQENVEDTAAAAGTSSHAGKQRGAEEIGLLTDLYAFYSRTQHYSSIRNVECMREFYNRQVNIYRSYATEEDVDRKVRELYDNYMKVMENKVEAPTDPIDVQIFRQSLWIWETGDDDMIKKPKHSSKRETGDGNLKDSSKHETGDVDMIEDRRDKQETGDDDVKGSRECVKDSGVITGQGRKDSPGKKVGRSAP